MTFNPKSGDDKSKFPIAKFDTVRILINRVDNGIKICVDIKKKEIKNSLVKYYLNKFSVFWYIFEER
jgi:hypothetical protein